MNVVASRSLVTLFVVTAAGSGGSDVGLSCSPYDDVAFCSEGCEPPLHGKQQRNMMTLYMCPCLMIIQHYTLISPPCHNGHFMHWHYRTNCKLNSDTSADDGPMQLFSVGARQNNLNFH